MLSLGSLGWQRDVETWCLFEVMVSMLFFVWHVAAEKQSGFRHLLHVSGLSRSA